MRQTAPDERPRQQIRAEERRGDRRLVDSAQHRRAARFIGVAPNTLLKWLKLPEFAEAYRQARRDAFSQSIARLQQASSAAVATLMKIMVDVNAPTSSRVRAADCVLGHAARAFEIEDIEVRVSELERTAGRSKSGLRG